MTIIATLDYDKNIFGLAIYDDQNKHFIISKDTYDNRECDILKSILYKLNVDLLLITFEMEVDRFHSISETTIKSIIVDQRTFRKIKNDVLNKLEFKISSLCFNALIIYLKQIIFEFVNVNINNITIATSKQENREFLISFGFIEDYPIYLFEHNRYLYVNNDSLKSLGVFRNKSNPNLMIKSKCADISLFALINHTSTSFGAEMLKNWICFPLLDIEKIEKRRGRIDYILKNQLSKKLIPYLKRCKNIANFNVKYNDGKIFEYFLDLSSFIRNSIEAFKIFNLEIDCTALLNILQICDNNIDLSGSNLFIIKKGTNEAIDIAKQLYDDLPEYLNEVAKKVMKDYQIGLTIVYFPQLGYLIETKHKIDQLEALITTKTLFYYKNEFMNVLDIELGDVLNKIYDLEKEQVILIKNKIDEYSRDLLYYKECIAEIDCINSLAISARKYDLKKSIISQRSKTINIKEFKNIFIDSSACDTLDIKIDGNILITGDNGSGKSSFLRSIGCLIILNQIGSFLPSKCAELSLFDKIFTKFYSTESIKNKKSAFMCDILLVNHAIYYGTSNSIFLVDEFGKGTNVIDGVSLLFALINNLDRFLCIFVTHFQEFIQPGMLVNVKNYFICNYKLYEGIFNEEYSLDIFRKLKFHDDFIEKFKIMKSKVKNNEVQAEERNETWAIKIINDFIMENM